MKARRKSKSPFKEVVHHLEKLTDAEKQRLMQDARRAIEERQKDEEDRHARRGKYDPKNIVLGTCRLCSGDLVEKVNARQLGDIKYGAKIRIAYVSDGFYCKRCGVRLEFIPSDEFEKVSLDEVELF